MGVHVIALFILTFALTMVCMGVHVIAFFILTFALTMVVDGRAYCRKMAQELLYQWRCGGSPECDDHIGMRHRSARTVALHRHLELSELYNEEIQAIREGAKS